MSEQLLESTGAVEAHGIVKSFGGVRALRGVDLVIRPGEVHALLGHNGAGKSTLIGILTGRVVPDAGHVLVGGERLEAVGVSDAHRAGVQAVYQELSLFENLSVAENLFFNDPAYYRRSIFRRAAAHRDAAELLQRLFGTARLDVASLVGELSVAQRQLTEIARALHRQARLVILDEPTASLSAVEVDELMAVLDALRRQGTAFLFVTHKLREAARIADRFTLMQDGEVTLSVPASEAMQVDDLEALLGKPAAIVPASGVIPAPSREITGEVVLDARALRPAGWDEGVDLEVRAGELVAVLGLTGSGRSSLVRSAAGVDERHGGTVSVGGLALGSGDLRGAIAAGVGFVPEDRRRHGAILGMGVGDNLMLPHLAKRRGAGRVGRRESAAARAAIGSLGVRTAGERQHLGALSGGNQQKVVVGRWLELEPLRVLVLDEPVKGVDVAAKGEIYRLVDRCRSRGTAVVLVASEVTEALAEADRILVLRDHAVVGWRRPADTTEKELLRMMGQAEGPLASAEAAA